MAIINSYSNDGTIHGADKLIGSDGTTGADAGKTKNYTVSSIAAWIGSDGLTATDVTVQGLTTTGKVKVSINPITCSAGGSTTLTADKHFNMLTFSGGNGTHVINLPASEDGLLLRFKTDGTFSNSKDCTLTPQSGETIDGATDYTADRDYDGITLMGYNGNWFIIQKKDK